MSLASNNPITGTIYELLTNQEDARACRDIPDSACRVSPTNFVVLLAIAHSGVRVGRKTYVVDLAGGNKRTDYVAVSNTVIGLVLLATGLIGTAAAVISLPAVIALLSLMGGLGAIYAWRLPET